MNITELKALLREGGVVGAGGAGFPSYAKLDERADTLILNCAECEPLLKLHQQLLEQHAEEILRAFDLIAKTIGAKSVILGIKKHYKQTIEAVEQHMAAYSNMSICRLPAVYPAGDEVVLIYEATGRVVPAGGLPIAVGVTVFNVETILNVANLLGGKPVTHKYVTVAGEVANPATFKVPVGTAISELIELAGGTTTPHPSYLMGGPMMGRIGSVHEPVTRTTNAVLVLPDDHLLIEKKQAKPFVDMKRAMAACCQCNYCTDLCPRHMLGHPIEPHKFMLYASNGITNDATPYLNSFYCVSCGLCELYSCGQGLAPRTLLAACKTGLRQNGIKPPAPEAQPVNPARDYRRVPMNRLMARLGLTAYDKPAPLSDAEPSGKQLRVLLSQHIGAPAKAVVAAGDKVTAGQVIAEAAENALSVNIHAPVNATVESVSDSVITLMKEDA
ncbi:MAG: SLBB domain-containing protein [Clostridia bacterium]|nr:SLBB domain-containing protein [Clostridia bacterium]